MTKPKRQLNLVVLDMRTGDFNTVLENIYNMGPENYPELVEELETILEVIRASDGQ
jgi:hypothetical protein